MVSNPSGYSFKEELLTGYISLLNNTTKLVDEENERYIEDVIKIDKDISASQTGSPILNKNGEVIGISSSKINSVIPINRVKNIITRLQKEEKFEEAYLGIYGFDNSSLKYLQEDYNFNIGVYVDKVEENSPVFDKVKVGDIIMKIDDYELSKMQDLSEYLYTKNKGDKVVLKVLQGTKEVSIECKLK